MVERVRTFGTFALDGQEFEVENNIWIVGNEDEVLVIDAAHDAATIAQAVDGRRVVAIVCTHGHNDHVNAAVELAERVRAPVALHSADRMLWDMVYPERSPDIRLEERAGFVVANTALRLLHTPGHTPGGICLVDDTNFVLFSGDTLFAGGPGATGRSFSDFDTIIESIRAKLLTLPPQTIVHTGHGEDTLIGEEAPHIGEWIRRGY